MDKKYQHYHGWQLGERALDMEGCQKCHYILLGKPRNVSLGISGNDGETMMLLVILRESWHLIQVFTRWDILLLLFLKTFLPVENGR